jgi:hypothetical protein
VYVLDITYRMRSSGFSWGSGRSAHLSKITPALIRVKPMNSRAATLSSLSGRSKGALVEESQGRIRTDTDELEVEELRLPWLEGGPGDHRVSN